MVWKFDRKYFEKHIVAQDDDNDYSESGYVVCHFPDQMVAIFRYSHCSCYGTWDSIANNGYEGNNDTREVSPVWDGTLSELKYLVENNLDPELGTPISKDNYDADHLRNCYKQLREKYAWN